NYKTWPQVLRADRVGGAAAAKAWVPVAGHQVIRAGRGRRPGELRGQRGRVGVVVEDKRPAPIGAVNDELCVYPGREVARAELVQVAGLRVQPHPVLVTGAAKGMRLAYGSSSAGDGERLSAGQIVIVFVAIGRGHAGAGAGRPDVIV